MVEPIFSHTVRHVGDVHLVSLQGELDLASAAGLFERLVETAGSVVVIDLSELTFMDSSGISAMVRTKNELGDGVVLTRPQPNVRRVFEITGLGDWFTEWDPAWEPSTDPGTGATD
jgi:anti-sigma B factor antagonist